MSNAGSHAGSDHALNSKDLLCRILSYSDPVFGTNDHPDAHAISSPMQTLLNPQIELIKPQKPLKLSQQSFCLCSTFLSFNLLSSFKFDRIHNGHPKAIFCSFTIRRRDGDRHKWRSSALRPPTGSENMGPWCRRESSHKPRNKRSKSASSCWTRMDQVGFCKSISPPNIPV